MTRELTVRLATAWRLVRDFTGDSAYDRYLEHQRLGHPGEPVLSEREFWQQRTEEKYSTPRASCC